MVAGQICFLKEIIGSSNRFASGLFAPFFSQEILNQTLRTFASSSYLWILGGLGILYGFTLYRTKAARISLGALALTLLGFFFFSKANDYKIDFSDFQQIFSETQFWISLALSITWAFFFHRQDLLRLSAWWRIALVISILSYFFMMPQNNPFTGQNTSYDYAFFMELPSFFRVSILTFCLYSIFSSSQAKRVFLMLMVFICLYFFRSHLAIPLMRSFGIVWYSIRDVFGVYLLLSYLVITGLAQFVADVSACLSNSYDPRKVQMVLASLLLIYLSQVLEATSDKIYYKDLNKLVSQNSVSEYLAATQNFFANLKKKNTAFFRLGTPGMSPHYLAGGYQGLGLFEAGIYDSTISSDLFHFYHQVILKRPEFPRDLRHSLPSAIWPKHVYDGLQIGPTEVPYAWVYLYSDDKDQVPYLKKENFDFWWSISLVKYLVTSNPEFYETLKLDQDEDYALVGEFPETKTRIYEFKNKSPPSRWAVIPVKDKAELSQTLEDLNSDDIAKMQRTYARMRFLTRKDFPSFVDQRPSNSEIFMNIELPYDGLVINLESWNRDWTLSSNSEKQTISHAFQIYRSFPAKKGQNSFYLEYNPPLVRGLMLFGLVFFVLNSLVLLFPSLARLGKSYED